MHVKKVTKKDRYGNQVTTEYEVPEKSLDYTELLKKQMELSEPDMEIDIMSMSAPPVMGEEFNMGDPMNHPGEPRGSDTVPAWLTPGEFVVNAEATEMFGPQIEAMNEVGRMAKGGSVYRQGGGKLPDRGSAAKIMAGMDPAQVVRMLGSLGNAYQFVAPALGMNKGGGVFIGDDAMDFAGPETLTEAQIAERMAAMRAASPGDVPEVVDVPVPISYDQALLEAREGFRDDVYLDSLGKPTVGHGHLLGEEYADRVGETPFTKEELDSFFREDMETAESAAIRNVGKETWDKLDRRQKGALKSMAFQLGEKGQKKFKRMIEAIQKGDYRNAAKEALTGSKGGKSKWLKQTPVRALDLAEAFDPDMAAQYRNAGGQVYDDMPVQYAFLGKLFGEPAEPSEITYDDPYGAQAQIDAALAAGVDPELIAQNLDIFNQGTEEAVPEIEDFITTNREVEDDELSYWDTKYGEGAPPPKVNEHRLDPTGEKQAAAAEKVAKGEITMDQYNHQVTGWQTAAEEQAARTEYEAAEATTEAETTVQNAEEKVETLDTQIAAAEEAGDTVLAEALKDQKATVVNEAANATNPDTGSTETAVATTSLTSSIAESVAADDQTNPDVPGSNDTPDPPASEVQAVGEQAAAADQTWTDKQKAKLIETMGGAGSLGGEVAAGIGSLFDAGELAKMAVYFGGAMLMGSTPMQALNFGLKQYLGGLDKKQAAAAKTASTRQQQAVTMSGRFTPESLQQFTKDGDFSKLKPIGTASKPAKITQTKVMIPGQGLVQVWEKDGTQYYKDRQGQATLLEGSGARIYDPATMGENAVREEFTSNISSEVGKINHGIKEDDAGYVAVNKEHIADEGSRIFREFLKGSKLPVESADELKFQIKGATNDYLAAVQAAEANGDPIPQSMQPYFEARMMAIDTQLNPGMLAGTTPKTQVRLNDRIQTALRSEGLSKDEAEANTAQYWQAASSAWGAVPPEKQESYAKSAIKGSNGFTYFMEQLLKGDEEALGYARNAGVIQ